MKNKIKLILILQIVIQIVFFIFGIYFKADSVSSLSANILGMLTKIQTTNIYQNFFWCFTNNFSVLFVTFWISYWSFGIIGTLWSLNTAFMLGNLIKLSVIINLSLSIIFMFLELISSIIAVVSSTYYRFDKYFGNDKIKREKSMIVIFILISSILLVAAILETIVLKFI